MTKLSAEVIENEDGTVDIGVECKVSGLPITRSNHRGMFCNGKPCQCEQEYIAMFGDKTNDEILEDIMAADPSGLLEELFGKDKKS